jgi:DNA-binding PadR family transcriptional regulator
MHHHHSRGTRFAHRSDGPPDEHSGRRGGRHRFGRGGGRTDLGRFFAHGDLRLVILQLIAEKPRHGYEIIKAIEDRVGGAYSPSPGAVYPTMTLLEELGHVTVTPGEGTKKLHEITPEGLAFLEGNRPAVDALLAQMADAARARGDGPPPSILRGMENLKLALRLRLGGGPLTDEQAAAITAALDAAAVAVERV